MNVKENRKEQCKKWSKAELDILVKDYARLGPKRLSEGIINRNAQAIKSKASALGIPVNRDVFLAHNLNQCNVSKFLEIKDPFIAYFLGIFWADGHLVKRNGRKNGFRLLMGLSHSDFLYIKNDVLKTSDGWSYRFVRSNNPKLKDKSVISLNSRRLWEFLAENDYLIKSGASPDKILSKIPDHLKHYWWRGYFDGDGSFLFKYHNRKCGRVTLASCIEQNWNFAIKLCQQYNIRYKIINQVKERGSGSCFIIGDSVSVSNFCNYIYRGKTFGFTRKRNSFLEYKQYKKQILNDKTSKHIGVCRHKHGCGWLGYFFHNGKSNQKFFKAKREAINYRIALEEKYKNK